MQLTPMSLKQAHPARRSRTYRPTVEVLECRLQPAAISGVSSLPTLPALGLPAPEAPAVAQERIAVESVALLCRDPFVVCAYPPPAPANPAAVSATFVSLPIETIEQGSFSAYGFVGWHVFPGLDLVIQDQASWETFWTLHTWLHRVPPELPAVDFERETVLVSLLGYQEDTGPGITIREVLFDAESRTLVVVTLEERIFPIPRPIIPSFPFHIVRVPRVEFASVKFIHERVE